MTASELFGSGKLREAIDTQLVKVKSHPADKGARLFLFELFCFAGELDRAKKQLDVLKYDDPRHDAAIEQFRMAMEAETTRRAVFNGTAEPTWLIIQPDHVTLRLEAIKLAGQGQHVEARAKLDAANEAVPSLKGTLNGKSFEGIYDADERFGTVIEVFGASGKYSWVALETVESITMNPPGRPLDVLYRPANIVLRDGPSGDVLLPGLYPNSYEAPDEELKLGRATEWNDAGKISRGFGGKSYMVGDDVKSFDKWRELMLPTA